MVKEHQLIAIFSEIDDFCKELDKNMAQLSLISPTKGKRGPTCCLVVSEIMTIQILFQMLGSMNKNSELRLVNNIHIKKLKGKIYDECGQWNIKWFFRVSWRFPT